MIHLINNWIDMMSRFDDSLSLKCSPITFFFIFPLMSHNHHQLASSRLDQLASSRLDQLASSRLDQLASSRLDYLNFLAQTDRIPLKASWQMWRNVSRFCVNVGHSPAVTLSGLSFFYWGFTNALAMENAGRNANITKNELEYCPHKVSENYR